MNTRPISTPELETLTDQNVARLKQIDRILEGPVRWLIAEAKAAAQRGEPLPRFHNWISRVAPIERQSSRVATSLCLVTLNRLNATRRRFPGLKDEFDGLGATLQALGEPYIPRRTGTDREYFDACCTLLRSDTLGALNPLTASQVFRVLMELGEGHAHSGAGCLAFFAMVWPLYRKNDEDRLDLGVRIEPGRPSAYVTMKCLLPLISLSNTCQHRAQVATEIVKHLKRLHEAVGQMQGSPYHEWRVRAELDQLVLHLREMAPISIAGATFKAAARDLVERLSTAGPTDGRRLYQAALVLVRATLAELKARNAELVADARSILAVLRTAIIPRLHQGKADFPGLTLGFAHADEDPDAERHKAYVRMLAAAAVEAVDLCEAILGHIQRVSRIRLPAAGAQPGVVHRSLIGFFDTLADANRQVSRLVSQPVDLQARWCHGIANREVAFTSADNFTDFDPAELISSIAISVRTDRFTTPAQLADAVKKAVLGAQPDGSWRLMHPYFSRDGAQGIRAPVADVVWTLTSAVSEFPEIDVADEELFRFVDWLERTQREIRPQGPRGTPLAPGQSGLPETAVGWASDQMRETDRVNLLTTAFSVNALLAIRDLVEHRLWELCKRRFTVVKETMTLFTMDPVDLLAPQAGRLHSRLARMAREVLTHGSKAAYSAVLHGPPGSSKTAVASALSKRMWRDTRRWEPGESRLVRITPADFTRHGEGRVESEAQLIFRLLGRVRGVTVLFDEIDDLLRRRDGRELSFLNLVVPAMLNRLQDLRDACNRQEICFLFGTNYVERIEPALMRQGRIDEIVPVTYPDHASRRCIAERILKLWDLEKTDEYRAAIAAPGGGVFARAVAALPDQLASRTCGWPWSAISAAAESIKQKVSREFAQKDPAANLALLNEVVDRELRAHSAQSQVNLNYPTRLRKQFDSQEMRHEVLYDRISHWSPSHGIALRPFLEQWIETLGSDPKGDGKAVPPVVEEMRQKLLDDLDGLPHVDSAVWNDPPAATARPRARRTRTGPPGRPARP